MVARGKRRLLAYCLVWAALSACGARSGLTLQREDASPLPIARAEICNGLDDDLDGLRFSQDGGRFEVGVRDAAHEVSAFDVAVFDAADATRADARPSEGGAIDASFDAGGRLDAVVADAGVDASLDGAFDAGIANDLDLFVDEDFRDALGRYVDDRHCGACNNRCVPDAPHETAAACLLVGDVPRCGATRCEAGYTPSRDGTCVATFERLCLPCSDADDCGGFVGARCTRVADESRCVVDCALGCPSGYTCQGNSCIPSGGSCACAIGQNFSLACALFDPVGTLCPGQSQCANGVQSSCTAPAELCDGVDQDCDGFVDNGFRDARGAYSLDVRNCGACGVDCTLSTTPEGTLVCGGDPLAPSCVLRCPDTEDGLQIGDRIDADRNIATGCECHWQGASDVPGPVLAVGEQLDVNCDGADGIVVESFYVAPDGNDDAIGSPTRPLRTLRTALRRAEASLATALPRPNIFVASGVYSETMRMVEGLRVYGGYRRDFLALDPNGFRSEVRARAGDSGPSGAALEMRGVGQTTTVLRWLTFRGLDASRIGQASFGAYAIDVGGALELLDLEIVSGSAGPGSSGSAGVAGASSPPAQPGMAPRAAVENSARNCVDGAINIVMGGAGAANACAGSNVGGGRGGSPICPQATNNGMVRTQPSGETGAGSGGGAGGIGGQDSRGPITGNGCPTAVCCGLADFSVPTNFQGPQPGRAGAAGTRGVGGTACTDPLGRFDGDQWVGGVGRAGSAGNHGSGGGGGGAGGGTQMTYMNSVCEFADGLGGGGGGGGAGGCGGSPGTGGESGGPSVALLLRYTRAPAAPPSLRNVFFASGEGGRGGDGGPGGGGGIGANGAFGGELPRSARTTPTLAGPFAGARGGRGGDGGDGGGGGGGCGGASIGVWVTGSVATLEGLGPALESNNRFSLGTGGRRGAGGGGAAPGMSGLDGPQAATLIR